MVNRIGLAAVLLALSGPSWAAGTALQDAKVMAGGQVGSYDGGCTGGSCGTAETPCVGEACRIKAASDGALEKGGLVVVQSETRPIMSATVPAPSLGADEPGGKDKPGFFSKLLSGKGLLYGLGSAAAGAGIGWLVGGPIGAIVGGLIGAIGGFFLSKMLAK